MIKKLYPTQYIQSIFDLSIETLIQEGIKGIIFDIDNTLVPYDVAEPTREIIEFFTQIQEAGIQITLVSNNTEDRVLKFNEKLKVLALHKAQKPLNRSFKKALEMMRCSKDEVIIVGDQIFTDVYGGNCFGIQTYLVVPISDKDEWQTKVKRGLERQVIKCYKKWLEKQA
ncbi:MAG: YqeG family HAD IIIA-type phosphatase [Cellulosilyticum sp.]|nr:YqeG family HAD IIIA-type phosphatase [Cellulosilyticum sp.]